MNVVCLSLTAVNSSLLRHCVYTQTYMWQFVRACQMGTIPPKSVYLPKLIAVVDTIISVAGFRSAAILSAISVIMADMGFWRGYRYMSQEYIRQFNAYKQSPLIPQHVTMKTYSLRILTSISCLDMHKCEISRRYIPSVSYLLQADVRRANSWGIMLF